MENEMSLRELGRRLEALQDRLDRKLGSVSGNAPPQDHSTEAGRLGDRVSSLRTRIGQTGDQSWKGVSAEVERDMHALERDFDDWVRRLDAYFREHE